MGLDIKKMDFDVLYKILDEKDEYYEEGTWYVRKYYNSSRFREPIIYVYHLDLNGKILSIFCGNYINRKYQNKEDFSIKGWVIDKDSSIKDVGKKDTVKEMSFRWKTLTPQTPIEQDLIDIEILDLLEDPVTYFNSEKDKGSK